MRKQSEPSGRWLMRSCM